MTFINSTFNKWFSTLNCLVTYLTASYVLRTPDIVYVFTTYNWMVNKDNNKDYCVNTLFPRQNTEKFISLIDSAIHSLIVFNCFLFGKMFMVCVVILK